MTIAQKLTQVVDQFVAENGSETIMSYGDLYDLTLSEYFIRKSSFLPSDYCYNRTNDGLDFESHIHLFEWVDVGSYRLLGSSYPYSGTVYYRKKGESVDSVYGQWGNGVFQKAHLT